MRRFIYDIDDEFNFGRYKGKTVRDLLKVNPGYVDWVIRNVDRFALSENAMQQALEITEGKRFSKEEAELERASKGNKSLFGKLYGWSFDFSSEELIQINLQKLDTFRKTQSSTSTKYRDDTDWSHYNDDRDMDQQSEDFWNQF